MDIDSRHIGVTGFKQVMRALDAGQLIAVYLADDVDAHMKRTVTEACGKAGVPVIGVPTMKELGRACGIEVSAACAGVLQG